MAERDSFREAMQGLLVGGDTSLEGDESESPPRPTGNGGRAGEGGSDGEAVWQHAALKGVMGSLLGGAAAGGTVSNAAYQSTIQSLQSEVIKLRKELEKLNELKKLKPRVEELEKALEDAQKAANEAEKWADDEFGVLSNKIEEVIRERDEVLSTLQQTREEVDRLHMQISRTAVKYTNYEEKLQTRTARIEALEKELKETNDKAIDPVEFEKLKDKVQELMG